jgi:hypothetical protein
MHVEEKTSGMPLTPEVRALVRTVMERSFARVAHIVDQLHVRLAWVHGRVECRAVLRPLAGATLAVKETRPSVLDALVASADGLSRELHRRYIAKSRRSRHPRAGRRKRPGLAA